MNVELPVVNSHWSSMGARETIQVASASDTSSDEERPQE